MKILLIPDCHITQGQDLSRFDKAGNLIIEERPDYIISMGDFMAMKSISHWDDNKRLTMEGRRYKQEVVAGKEALQRLHKPLQELQAQQRDNKKAIYKPKEYFLEGNHEAWVGKYLEQHPAMQGHIDVKADLELDKYGFIYVPYRRYTTISNILFCHIVIGGDNQPIRGVNLCATASRYVSRSCVFAHAHRWETSGVKREGAPLIQLLTCGCFFEEEPDEFGAHPWRGLTMLDVWDQGRFDASQISLERLYEKY